MRCAGVFCSTCAQINAWSLLSRSAVRIQISHPCNRMETTRDLNSFKFSGKLMELLLQMTLSLVMADAARLSFVFSSFVELPSFVKVEPRYLKLFTSASFSPFSAMEVAASWVRLFIMTAFLRVSAVLSSLMVRSWSSASLPPEVNVICV